jgi:putative aldouronate transport system permease protein
METYSSYQVKTHVRKKGHLYHLKTDYNFFLMVLPGIIGFALFIYVPIINGLLLPFVKYDLTKGVFGSKWIGFKYFIQFFTDPYFFRLLRNTLSLSFLSLIFSFPAPIILALLINEVKSSSYKRVVQSISYLPHFISTVIVVGIMYTMFGYDGVFNTVLGLLGKDPIRIIGVSKWFRTLYVSSGVWQSVGWNSILYLAALSAIDMELHDAAKIDGANRWQLIKHINIPCIMPTITILLIFAVSGLINVGFEKVYLMYNPGMYEVADVISTYVYRRGIEGMDYSFAAAVNVFNAITATLLMITANTLSKKITDTSLW